MGRIPGAYKQSLQGYRTFLPDPLPPHLELPRSVERGVERATHLLGQVEMCRTLLPNANLLTYSSFQREAIASSTIEDTIASPDELVLFQVSEHADRRAVREVANYVAALEWGFDALSHRPIAARFILELHERLLSGVRGQGSAGRFKDGQNRIGSDPSEPFEHAVFVPPPPEDVHALIADLERYINLENNEPLVVQCALVHYQFETIHPFNDGNGRVGRLLIILQMIQLGLLSAPLIYPSVYFERTRQEYYRRLQAVRDHGSWIEWIDYFVQGVIVQSHETIAFTQNILTLRQEMKEIGNVRRRASIQAVLDAFFQNPALSIPEIRDYANIAYNSVQAALDELSSRGIVYEITGGQRGRVFVCRPVFDAVFGRTSS